MAKKKEKGLLETVGDSVLSLLAFNPDAVEATKHGDEESTEVIPEGTGGGGNGVGRKLKPGSTFQPAPAKRKEPAPVIEPDEPPGEEEGEAAKTK